MIDTPVLEHVLSEALREGGEFASRNSRASIGLSLDADVVGLARGKRVYLFSPRPWTAEVVRDAMREVGQ